MDNTNPPPDTLTINGHIYKRIAPLRPLPDIPEPGATYINTVEGGIYMCVPTRRSRRDGWSLIDLTREKRQYYRYGKGWDGKKDQFVPVKTEIKGI